MILTTAALILAGCADAGPGIYDGEQTESDMLPTQVPAAQYDFDTDSSRLLATHLGYRFFAVSSPNQGDCLLSFDPDAPGTWVAGCSSGGRVATSGLIGIQADYDPNGLPDVEVPEGWTRLTPQLQVSEG
ncbi:hypothetical protein [Kocuria nitroreducens]|uniref:hypothetical protein n=1 Tax=Kocuria nitroreducens TaxID=3058914 RepID=UPI0036DBAF90